MIDISRNELLSMAQAGRKLGCNPATVWRWARHGVRGVRLEYQRLGRRMVTTEAALQRFIERLTELDRQADASATPAHDHGTHMADEAEAAAEGL